MLYMYAISPDAIGLSHSQVGPAGGGRVRLRALRAEHDRSKAIALHAAHDRVPQRCVPRPRGTLLSAPAGRQAPFTTRPPPSRDTPPLCEISSVSRSAGGLRAALGDVPRRRVGGTMAGTCLLLSAEPLIVRVQSTT
eukprot:1196020-Prorocentrum_minimum.AAC.10